MRRWFKFLLALSLCAAGGCSAQPARAKHGTSDPAVEMVKSLTALRDDINARYGFRNGNPRINLGPCGRFARDFRECWNSQFEEPATIAFIMGKLYELTGPKSQDMHAVAREFSDALNREVTYVNIPPGVLERELNRLGMPKHVAHHIMTMGELHRAGRYDRLTDGVQRVTGRSAMSVREFVSLHADAFGGRR